MRRKSRVCRGFLTLASSGLSIVPSMLLRAQQRLGLNPSHLGVLFPLADYWWSSDRKPYPGEQALRDGRRIEASCVMSMTFPAR